MKLYSDEELAVILDQDVFHKISEVADQLGVECYVAMFVIFSWSAPATTLT